MYDFTIAADFRTSERGWKKNENEINVRRETRRQFLIARCSEEKDRGRTRSNARIEVKKDVDGAGEKKGHFRRSSYPPLLSTPR